MGEAFDTGEKMNKGRRDFLKRTLTSALDLTKGVILGGGAASTILPELRRGSERSTILPKIPDPVEDELTIQENRTRMNVRAKSFFLKNKEFLGFDTETGNISLKPNSTAVGNVERFKEPKNKNELKEIRAFASSDGSTVGIYFLNEGGKSGTSITVCRMPDDEFEITNYEF